MICARYGPAAVGWDGVRTYVNPPRCSRWVELRDIVEELPLDRIDRRLLYLLGIPRGYVTTYKLYAEALGTSPRHVGWLMAENPLPVLLPCHRVVKSDMTLGGYAGGVELKRRLLEYEGALCGGKPCRIAKPRPVADIKNAILQSLGVEPT
ncbi:MGMT family protein [Pyrobaculum neutrophilum]|uniref:Methylated-DNA--protein-cysteine methyltransferase n=1 Tax=Pyrobaculum neutrophilum (strain DSM 2338 / JCM 9278 / NBRC 100436 / V24Sta) TaxID=444157 RepID=B1Y8Y8_PYRNV|nr:methylated-DNA--[protein]-cysteine S-methyltransferase [Pyrobaculum neutrophilum]ACB40217.1 methylated-DNA--protein-cysteine methyltransferase [Pyrobaculum neutrophilum V24Sta]